MNADAATKLESGLPHNGHASAALARPFRANRDITTNAAHDYSITSPARASKVARTAISCAFTAFTLVKSWN